MGYSTDFNGELKFKNELSASQLAKINSFLGEDCRKHPEWDAENMTYIDLVLLDDFTGIKWDGSEKTYDLDAKINLITREMRKLYPEFEFVGEMVAQGESMDDRWMLKIIDGVAVRQEIVTASNEIQCPHCGKTFVLEHIG